MLTIYDYETGSFFDLSDDIINRMDCYFTDTVRFGSTQAVFRSEYNKIQILNEIYSYIERYHISILRSSLVGWNEDQKCSKQDIIDEILKYREYQLIILETMEKL